MDNFRGAIFDMDGTLLDSMHMWLNVGPNYLEKCGIIPPEDINTVLLTLTMEKAADYFVNVLGLKKRQDEIIKEINEHIESFYREEVTAKSSVASFLKRLSQSSVKMCIATATDRPLAEAALKRCGIREYFSDIFTCSQIGVGKERADIYHAALSSLGTGIEETLVFEDALYAAKTAAQAGFRVVGVFDENSAGDWEQLCETAEMCIYSYDEISV